MHCSPADQQLVMKAAEELGGAVSLGIINRYREARWGAPMSLPKLPPASHGDTDLREANSIFRPFSGKWDWEWNCFRVYKRNNPGVSHSPGNTLKRPGSLLKHRLFSVGAVSDTITPPLLGHWEFLALAPVAFLPLALYFSTNKNDIFV